MEICIYLHKIKMIFVHGKKYKVADGVKVYCKKIEML